MSPSIPRFSYQIADPVENHQHGLGDLFPSTDNNNNDDVFPATDIPFFASSTSSQHQDQLKLDQRLSYATSSVLRVPVQKIYRQIIHENPAFQILKTRTDQELEVYLSLSDQEFATIADLRHVIRSASNPDLHQSQGGIRSSVSSFDLSSSVSSQFSSRTRSLGSIARSSITSTESNPHKYQRARKTPKSALYQQSLPNIQQNRDAACQSPVPPCSYWCTVCKHPRHFQTEGGWIKHEKEAHEGLVYVCMPDGPTSYTQDGLVCVLCRCPNPDAAHFEKHNITSCMNKTLTARTFKRKYQILKHLESHVVPEGLDVAHGWRRRCNKKAWACGFCVAYFAKPNDRFHHIATQHFERGEGMDKWDTSKVILGLLQQSRVHRAWKEFLQSQFPRGDVPELRWDTTPNGSLITMLELGLLTTEDPKPLAVAAFLQSDYYQDQLLNGSVTNPALPVEGGYHIDQKVPGMAQDVSRLSDDIHESQQCLPTRCEPSSPPPFEAQSFLPLDSPPWPDPILFPTNGLSDSEMHDPTSPPRYKHFPAPEPERPPIITPSSTDRNPRPSANYGTTFDSPPKMKRPTARKPNPAERPSSPMEIDSDLELLTRALLHGDPDP